MESHELAALVAAACLAAVHLGSGALRFLAVTPRSRWLSAFGGISVAYVFVHLLPELAAGQEAIERGGAVDGPPLGFVEEHVYLVALAGLALFYGVEQHSLRSRRERGRDGTGTGAFWLSIGSFAAYNVIVGYLLLRAELEELRALALYAFALGVHFVVNDHGLREHHRQRYDRAGRWIISAAVLAGWLVGVVAELPERVIAVVVAFIGGGVILNVLKEELPEERQSRFTPFALGAAAYTAMLQAV